jgi:hypothetical protein
LSKSAGTTLKQIVFPVITPFVNVVTTLPFCKISNEALLESSVPISPLSCGTIKSAQTSKGNVTSQGSNGFSSILPWKLSPPSHDSAQISSI